MVKMRAVVDWLTEAQGGRRQPPAGGFRYSPLVRFVDTQEAWPPPVAWSFVVEKVEALSEPYRWIADVHFLVPEAPHEALRPGREFELYEGCKCVARGRILGDPIEAGAGMAATSTA